MVDSTYYLDKNMPDRYMHNIYLYGPGQFAQVVSRWNCESLVGHILLALEDLDPTYQRGGPLGFGDGWEDDFLWFIVVPRISTLDLEFLGATQLHVAKAQLLIIFHLTGSK